MNTKKTLDYLLSSNNKGLGLLLDKVKKIAELDKIVRAELSHPLADYSRVANIRQSKLVLQVDSPVWASKLRFESANLLARLREQPRFAGLAGIDFFVEPLGSIVDPIAEKMNQPAAKKQSLSAMNKQLLLETADKTSDPKLKAVLQKIAERE